MFARRTHGFHAVLAAVHITQIPTVGFCKTVTRVTELGVLPVGIDIACRVKRKIVVDPIVIDFGKNRF